MRPFRHRRWDTTHDDSASTASPAEARQNVRQAFFEAGRSEGMTWRDARRYVHSYGVSIVAGWCDHDEAVAGVEAGPSDQHDREMAAPLAAVSSARRAYNLALKLDRPRPSYETRP